MLCLPRNLRLQSARRIMGKNLPRGLPDRPRLRPVGLPRAHGQNRYQLLFL